MMHDMVTARVVALLLASTAVIGLTACTGPDAGDDDSSAVTTPQPDIEGEWVLTRTVVASDDASTPARAVGAQSIRYVLVERESCDDALCPGTVSSGSTPDNRESVPLSQVDGGFEYSFSGALDCLNVNTGGVLAVDAFEFDQKATLTVGAAAESGGEQTATSLTGTIRYTDTLTADGAEAGCLRTPTAVTVDYSVTAVRAP